MTDRSVDQAVLLKKRNHLDAHRQELLQFEQSRFHHSAYPDHVLGFVDRNPQRENALAFMPHNQ